MPPEPVETQRPTLSIREAAEACNVSRITIRRRLDDDQFPNAFKSEGRQPSWRIPVTDLIAANLAPNAYVNPEPELSDPRDDEQRLRDELSLAREQIIRLRAEKELAEALAGEREKSLNDLRQALKMIEAPRPVQVVVPRRRWFGRKPKVVEVPVGEQDANHTDVIRS